MVQLDYGFTTVVKLRYDTSSIFIVEDIYTPPLNAGFENKFFTEGFAVGCEVGLKEGKIVGFALGALDGHFVGSDVGFCVGFTDGF